ncbi:pyridoxal phosphate-dependent aminotransferase [Magnetospirillum sp. UT-4]|uniref:pyridoxal phosphate-dependent aminotransferase n=1 Tax=Magnetospirillum sp. UT-4 TaxID=2681467 RepID=UPI0013863E83|nr:pyridoxal phosphate-dependent aminotransferase [Magnetospirillum sp. UT-4]CAA7618463.1 Aspartate aminotransferase [Magnetospirillum sp. UT-4]
MTSLAPPPPADIDECDFSARARALVGQEMFKVLDRAKAIEDAGHRVFHLELGNPKVRPPEDLIQRVGWEVTHGNTGYTYSGGLPELRRAIAERYATPERPLGIANVVVSPANLLINQFLDLCCERGDRVALFSPAFPTYWAAAAHIGLEAVAVELDRGIGLQLSFEAVDRAVAATPKAIIVNSANNPTGAVYSRPVLDYLVEQCARHGIWILSDETYGELTYDHRFHSLVGSSYPRLVVMSSFSKVLSVPAFRAGFAIADPRVVDKLVLSNSTLYSCLPGFVQAGLVEAMKRIDGYIYNVARHYHDVARDCAEALRENPWMVFTLPRSAFYFFIDIGFTGMTDMDFCRRLLEERHVAVTPGSAFGPAHRDQVRIAFCGQADDVREGIRRLADFARRET